ncbi:MAG: hypothetical protein ACI841_001130 [Planctomycetota bacterium]|jgi:hypothetical protein
MNADGAVDLLGISSTGDTLATYINSGGGARWTETAWPCSLSFLPGRAAIDLDDDTDLDVVAMGGEVRVYENSRLDLY